MCKIPFLSIIIPCYNSEKFVRGTIESVVRQNLENVELILVNDGSGDNTLEVLREYEDNYKNVICINQDNQGVSVARNTGIAAARGQYLYFLDSDDIMPEGTLQHFQFCVKQQPDVEVFSFGYLSFCDEVHCKSYVSKLYDGKVMKREEFFPLVLRKIIDVHNSSCLYSRDFVLRERLCFRPGVKIGEDILWLLGVFQLAGKVFYSKRVCFHYIIREDSVMQGYCRYHSGNFNSFLLIKQALERVGPEYRRAANQFVAVCYLSNLLFYLRSRCWNREIEEDFICYETVLREKLGTIDFYVCLIYFFRLLSVRSLFSMARFIRMKF